MRVLRRRSLPSGSRHRTARLLAVFVVLGILAVHAGERALGSADRLVTGARTHGSLTPGRAALPSVTSTTAETPSMLLPAPTRYPYAAEADPMALDPWGMVKRQCVSFVAWWLNAQRIHVSTMVVGPLRAARLGDAADWDAGAQAAGFAVSSSPHVGAVAQWRAGESSRVLVAGRWQPMRADRHGHVALVLAVFADGSVRWADYNWAGSRSLHITRGTAPRYITFAR
jgi:surface antigen